MKLALMSAVAVVVFAFVIVFQGLGANDYGVSSPSALAGPNITAEGFLELSENEAMLGWIYAKAGVAGVHVEVKSIGGTPICGGTGYNVENLDDPNHPTFDLASNQSFIVGEDFVIGSLVGSSGCGPLPKKYNAPAPQ